MTDRPDSFSYAPLFRSLEKLGLKTYDLDDLAHIGLYTVCQINAGKSIGLYDLAKIVYYLGLDLSDILEFNHRPADVASAEINKYLSDRAEEAEQNRKMLEERDKHIDFSRVLKKVDPKTGKTREFCPNCNSHRITVHDYDLTRHIAYIYCEDCGWSAEESYLGKPFAPKHI